MFSDAHREQLRDYFSGQFAGRMGLKSWMGPALEHAQSAALHPIDRSAQYIKISPPDQSSQRANHEISNDARSAARADGHLRATLRLLDVCHVQTLRLAYTPQPRGATRALVALVLGDQHASELATAANGQDRDKRREARKALASGTHRADALLTLAHDAFAEAEAIIRAEAKAERTARIMRSMGVAA